MKGVWGECSFFARIAWPEHASDLSRFMQRMTNMHTERWLRAKCRVGYGHLYQGRFQWQLALAVAWASISRRPGARETACGISPNSSLNPDSTRC